MGKMPFPQKSVIVQSESKSSFFLSICKIKPLKICSLVNNCYLCTQILKEKEIGYE